MTSVFEKQRQNEQKKTLLKFWSGKVISTAKWIDHVTIGIVDEIQLVNEMHCIDIKSNQLINTNWYRPNNFLKSAMSFDLSRRMPMCIEEKKIRRIAHWRISLLTECSDFYQLWVDFARDFDSSREKTIHISISGRELSTNLMIAFILFCLWNISVNNFCFRLFQFSLSFASHVKFSTKY